MAARGRVVVALVIILCAILPLLASAALPINDEGFNSLSIPTDRVDERNGDSDRKRRINTVMRPQNLKFDKKGKNKDNKRKQPKPLPPKPANPVGPVAPVTPANPVGPVAPVTPANPVGPVAPVTPTNPVGPVAPVTAANLVGPVAPITAPVNPVGPAAGGLRVGFYEQTCPQAERIIQETMDKIFERDVKVAPALVRLFFHDCFVTGCDASILLEKTPTGEKTERESEQNGAFVRGFAEIEEIKAALEAECPGVVSCADTLAFAARESLAQNQVKRYPVAAGRRDRPVSLAVNAQRDLPFPDTPAQVLMESFEKKGLTIEDLVVLIGAHSIGESHCTVFSGRFQDPEKRNAISPAYLDQLHVQGICVDPDQTLPFDRMSQNILDAGYYKQLLAHETLIESDQNLADAPKTKAIMQKYADDQEGWIARFIQAMTKLGELEVLTGDQGEIRKQCRAIN